MECKRIDDEISRITNKLDGLGKEKESNALAIDEITLEIENYNTQVSNLQRWLEKYEELLSRLDEEAGKRRIKQKHTRS